MKRRRAEETKEKGSGGADRKGGGQKEWPALCAGRHCAGLGTLAKEEVME